MAVDGDVEAKAKLAELILQARRSARRNIATLVGITLISTTAFFWLQRRGPETGTLEFEAAKAALQILSVAVLGGIISTVAFQFQRSRTDLAEWHRLEDERQEKDRKEAVEAKRQEKLREEERREREHVRAEDRRDRQAEKWRRGREEERDRRARQDQTLRNLLQSTVVSYNGVKRVRRLVSAVAVDAISLHDYDSFLHALIDLQLQFEEFARLAPLIDDERLAPPTRRSDPAGAERVVYVSLAEAYEDIESYLNKVVGEYKDCRQYVVAASAAGETFPMTRLPKLEGLKHKGDFRPGVSHHVNDIREVLQVALLEPIRFTAPQVDDLLADVSGAPVAGATRAAHSG